MTAKSVAGVHQERHIQRDGSSSHHHHYRIGEPGHLVLEYKCHQPVHCCRDGDGQLQLCGHMVCPAGEHLSTGLYTAPSTGGSDVVTAKSVAMSPRAPHPA